MRIRFGPPKAQGPKHAIVDLELLEEVERSRVLHSVEILNRLWRIKSTVLHHGKKDQKEFSLILRNVSSALDIFEQMGFSIKDHTEEKAGEQGPFAGLR